MVVSVAVRRLAGPSGRVRSGAGISSAAIIPRTISGQRWIGPTGSPFSSTLIVVIPYPVQITISPAMRVCPRATAIVTNPTHFAVALRYVPGETRAPMIIAMGKGPMALEIMARGRKVGLAPVQIPLLARALYFTGDIGVEIDEQLYAAVAAVLAHVYRLDRGEGSDLPDIDLPPELRFSEFGQRGAA